jgi:CubicO group peptidase (beta-lactamase class C family)
MWRTIEVLILFLIPVTILSQNPQLNTDYSPLIEDLKERIPKGLNKHNIPGLSIALVDKDGIVWQEGFGYADKETKTPAKPNTSYRVGSLSKMFTSVGIMRLVDKGQIEPDSTLDTYLPDFSMKSRFGKETKPPTIRQLLTHYAGLPANYIKGILDKDPKSLDSYVNLLSDQYYAFKPNTVYCYSGTGYSLLGLLIEEITGKSFAKYMEENVLLPLDMEKSAFQLNATIEEHLASGYLKDEKRQQFPVCDVPAGGLYSNVGDLANFIKMSLHRGHYEDQKILSSSAFSKLVEPQNGNHPFDYSMRIGLGWKLDGIAFTYGENLSHLGTVTGHGGQTVLFRSKIMMALDQGVGVIILCNSSNGKELAWPLVSEIVERMAAAKKGVKTETTVKKHSGNENVEPFPKDNASYYASRWGVMKMTPKNDKQRIRLSIPDRKMLLKKDDQGGYDVRYLALGFLPIKVSQLNRYHFGFMRKADTDVMVRTSEGMAQFFGSRIEKDSIPPSWRKRTGHYKGRFSQEEAEIIQEMKLYVQDGYLMMNLKLPLITDVTLRLALNPISDKLAYVKGHSRMTGDVLKVKEENGEQKLMYAGLPLIKQD